MDHNFEIIQGDTWVVEITYLNDDGTPVDLTGAEVEMQMRSSPGSSVVVLDVTPYIQEPQTPGKIFIVVPSTVMSTLAAPDKGRYDMKVRFPTSFVVTILRGGYVVVPTVTR